MIMRKTIFTLFVSVLAFFGAVSTNAQDLMITGVADGPLTGGLPKVLELYAVNDVADLSAYTVKKQTNESTDWTGDLALSGSASAGDFIYVVYVDGDMANFNGFFENSIIAIESNVINLNGNDRVGLFNASSEMIDIFGEDGMDGTGLAWDWKDGWAYRVNNATASSTFTVADWTFSGVDAFEGGTTNATCTSPFPIGTFTMGDPLPSLSITSPDNDSEIFSADVNVEFTVQNFDVADGTGDGYVTYTLDGGSAVNHMTTDPIALTGLSEEEHTIVLELVDNSGVSLDPVVKETVSFTVNLNPEPVISIVSPEMDEVVNSTDVNIEFTVQNFDVADGTGDGYIAYTLDGASAVNHTTTDPISLLGLSETEHTIVLELVDNSGVSFDPPVTATVTFTVNLAGTEITPIYDIQFTEDASGDSPMIDQEVTVKGIVTAKNEDKFWIQDAPQAWSGIYVFYTSTPSPAIGDSVILTGNVTEYYDATQIADVTDLTVLSSGYTVVSVEITTDQANEEAYESVLVQIEGTNTVEADDYGQWTVNDGSGPVLVDDFLFDYEPILGNDYNVTGIATYSFDERKIYPRDADDIIDLGVSTNPSLMITSPTNGQIVYVDAVDISFTVSNFVLGTDGKIAYEIDGGTVNYQTSNADITFTGLSEDTHTVSLELVDMDNNSLNPQVTASVEFTVNLAGPTITPIYEIQYTEDASGDSPLIGEEVTVEGVITANFNGSEYGEGYYIQDAAGAWNGIYVFDTDNSPSIGDLVRITADVDEFFDMTQLESVSDFQTLDIGVAVHEPALVTTAAAASEEQYESCLVRVEDAECTTEQNQYGEWTVDDGSGDVMCKDNGAFDGFTEELGKVYNITGVIAYSYGEYSLHYRIASDIEVVQSIEDGFAYNTSIYPNPANDWFTIDNLNGIEEIQIVNVMGQVVYTVSVDAKTKSINTSEFDAGLYMIKLISGNNSRLIKLEIL
jgi:predicted extracellular nuclease